MKHLIFFAVVLVFAATLFAQTGANPPWPYQWGTPGNFVSYQTPFTASGYIYEPATYEWDHGTETGKSYMTVTADIEMYMSMSFDATDIYFHIADNGQYFDAFVNGTVCSNNGQHIFVSSELDTKDLTELRFEQDIFGHDRAWYTANGRPMPNDIPVEWWLTDDCDGGVYRPGTYSQGGNNGNLWGIQWLLCNGTQCCHPFTLKIIIRPEFHQPDGRYEMDPMVTVAPVL